ncbi:transposase [Novosphingobium sp. SG707]|nr:transposase [Novosphingobium sp. SG707]
MLIRGSKSDFNVSVSLYMPAELEGRVLSLLPDKYRGARRMDSRRVPIDIGWMLRSFAPWRDWPERYGPRTTCDNRSMRWGKAGVRYLVMDAITTAEMTSSR